MKLRSTVLSLILLGLCIALAACKSRNPKFCAANDPCTEGLPVCDLQGTCAASDFVANTCIATACWDAGCTGESDAELCLANSVACGQWTDQDRCGVQRTVDCGGCVTPETCGGGGTDNQCGCTPMGCGDIGANGAECGAPDDGCGTALACGSCDLSFGCTVSFTCAPGWTLVGTTSAPPVGPSQPLTFDSVRQEIVLPRFVSYDPGLTDEFETWVYEGSAWTLRSPAASPSPSRSEFALAFDSSNQDVVLFGGTTNNSEAGDNGLMGDTWLWNGTTWTQVTPSTNPSPRSNAAMVFNSLDNVAVLFGGYAGNPTAALSNDTWSWDGTSWALQTPATSPPARMDHAMAYDAARNVVVMFGGGGVGILGDTWEWDGSNWTLKTPTVSPPARTQHSMAYDVSRQRVVLFGGTPADADSDDTWEWDGTSWVDVSSTLRPQKRRGHGLAYDSLRSKLVLFGGSSHQEGTGKIPPIDTFYNNTWER